MERALVLKNIMDSPKVYFISGVSGVGKTSTIAFLKKLLPADTFDVRDLDERGVPDGGGLNWLNNETRYWLDIAINNAKEGKNTVVCGFANPDLFKEVYKPGRDIPAELILLHASPEILEGRLRARHSTPESIKKIERASGAPLEKFIDNNKSFVNKLKEIFNNNRNVVIETDNKTPEEVAREIYKVLVR